MKPRKTRIITATPVKEELKMAKSRKDTTKQKLTLNIKKSELEAKKQALYICKISKQKCTNRQKNSTTSTDVDDGVVLLVHTDGVDSNNEKCILCSEPYRNDVDEEQSIRCIQCHRWMHEMCADLERVWKTYACDFGEKLLN